MCVCAKRNQKMSWRLLVGVTLLTILSATPVLIACIEDFVTQHEVPYPDHGAHPDNYAALRYLAWLAVISAVFGLYQLTDDAALRTHQEKAEALSRLLYDGSFLYAAAGIREKIFEPERPLLMGSFLVWYAYFALLYTVGFLVVNSVVHVTLTPEHMYKRWWAVIPAGAVVLLALSNQLYAAWRVSETFFTAYVSVASIVVLAHFLVPLLYSRVRVHLHHWYWALLCAHACIFNTPASQVSQAMFFAVYMHGVCVFGADEVFEDATPRRGSEAALLDDDDELKLAYV